MPATGMMPIVMPTFSNTWKTSMASTPTQISVPTRSRDRVAARQVRQMTMANSSSSRPDPTSPTCSPTAVKMKSVRCSGTYDRLVWVPLPMPLPMRPPSPMVIFDSARLYSLAPAGRLQQGRVRLVRDC